MLGTTLGAYRIEAKLGSGGMGIVYRAVDQHLGRPVAVKVLPAAALASADRRKRFVQEAKTASSLNHPNIVTIYDIDSQQADGDQVDYIAMEFISGQTLDHLIGRKGLRLREALRYAVQMADALAAAHAAGIVHRDLKPSNVMVTEQGLVKVLDFGLAKMDEKTEPDAYAATQSMRASPPLTEEGTVLGTIAYMSPEQAEGRKLDSRSDIFSFGSVLYEMVTGRQPFSGPSKLSALSAILSKEPEPLSEAVPLELEKTISRCLKKEPERRWQTMADLRVALQEVLDELDSSKLVAGAGARVRPRQRSRLWLAAALAGIVLGLGPGAWLAHRLIPDRPAVYQRLTFRRGDVSSARFAPGGAVVYSAEWDGGPATLFSAQPGSREARPLGLPSGRVLSITPAGEMAILLGGVPGTLARVPFSGGAPREILENVSGAGWAPDGESLAVVRTIGSRHRLEYPIGTILYESEGRPPLSPHVSPDGRLVAFFDFDLEPGDYSVAVAGPGRPREVLSRGWRAIGELSWSHDAREIWFSAGGPGEDPALYAVDLRGRQRIVTQAPGWMMMHDVARDGRVLVGSYNSRVGILCLGAASPAERDLAWLDASLAYEISADGKWIVFSELSYSEGRNSALYLRNTDGSAAVRLGYGNRPALSPDGKWVVSIRHDRGRSSLLLLPTGPGESRLLSVEGMRYESVEWFADSRRILFSGNAAGRPARTWMRDLSGAAPRPVTPEGERATRPSPDGKSVIVSRAGGLWLVPLEGGAGRRIGDVERGETPIRWSPDARYLYLRRPGRELMTIKRLEIATGRKEPWRELKVPEPGAGFIGPLSLSPDGRFYACSFQRDLGNLYLVTGLK